MDAEAQRLPRFALNPVGMRNDQRERLAMKCEALPKETSA